MRPTNRRAALNRPTFVASMDCAVLHAEQSRSTGSLYLMAVAARQSHAPTPPRRASPRRASSSPDSRAPRYSAAEPSTARIVGRYATAPAAARYDATVDARTTVTVRDAHRMLNPPPRLWHERRGQWFLPNHHRAGRFPVSRSTSSTLLVWRAHFSAPRDNTREFRRRRLGARPLLNRCRRHDLATTSWR